MTWSGSGCSRACDSRRNSAISERTSSRRASASSCSLFRCASRAARRAWLAPISARGSPRSTAPPAPAGRSGALPPGPPAPCSARSAGPSRAKCELVSPISRRRSALETYSPRATVPPAFAIASFSFFVADTRVPPVPNGQKARHRGASHPDGRTRFSVPIVVVAQIVGESYVILKLLLSSSNQPMGRLKGAARKRGKGREGGSGLVIPRAPFPAFSLSVACTPSALFVLYRGSSAASRGPRHAFASRSQTPKPAPDLPVGPGEAAALRLAGDRGGPADP